MNYALIDRIVFDLLDAQNTPKVCSCCSRSFESVPNDAELFDDPGLGGFYWNCSCGTTLYVPCLLVAA